MPTDADFPRLCLVLEVSPAADLAARAENALASPRAATLILTCPEGTPLDQDLAKSLIAVAHKRGIAALVENDAKLAKALGADGVHLTAGTEDPRSAYEAARALLGKNAIIGADAGHSRHDAMELGEAGADYIAFGLPAEATDTTTAEEDRLDLVSWWAELFEVPVVAFDVATPEEAQDLADNGADFLAARVPLDLPAAAVREWALAIAEPAAHVA